MKIFKWVKAELRGREIRRYISLIERIEKDKIIFWASINPQVNNENKYEFVAFDRKRNLQATESLSSIDEAKNSIEKFLSSEGIIEDGDEINE